MKGRTAFVTGGAGGIGSAICKAFLAEGVNVVVADVDLERSQEVAASIGGAEQNALAVEIDIADENSVERAVAHAAERFGPLHFAAYCVGNNVKAPLLDMTLQQWQETLDTHLTGAFLMSREVGKHMVDQGEGGRIVFISSVAAWAPIPERGAYGPAKAALVNFAGLLAVEWARFGITVNAVCPNVVLTPMTKVVYGRDPQLRAQRLKKTPLGREVLPEEVADLVLFLCGDSAGYITGAAVPIDGGFLSSGFMPEELVRSQAP